MGLWTMAGKSKSDRIGTHRLGRGCGQRALSLRPQSVVEGLEQRRLLSLTIAPLPVGANPVALANDIVVPDTGLTITGGNYVGADQQGATYTNFRLTDPNLILSMPDGVLLTSGSSAIVAVPNVNAGAGVSDGTIGDTDLDTLIAGTTYDANSLTIQFTADPSVHSILFDFIFASEEFPEFVGSPFNDVFAAYLDGNQVSLDSAGQVISVNNNFFNLDNSHVGGPATAGKTPVTFDIEYDGLTPRIRTQAPLSAAGTHTLKFVIADAADSILDSGVFITRLQGSDQTVGSPQTQLPTPGAIDVTAQSLAESAGTQTITLHRLDGVSGELTVHYALTNGSATSPGDFLTNSGQITFADGESQKTVTVSIVDDSQVEGDEIFDLQLTDPSDGQILTPTTPFTIVDNDCDVGFTASRYRSRGQVSSITVTVQRMGSTAATTTVNYATADATALAGRDYTPVSGTLTFAPGETVQTFDVPILADSPAIGMRSLNVMLSDPTTTAGSANTDFRPQATVTIADLHAPTVTGVQYVQSRGRIAAVQVQFSEAVNVIGATGDFQIVTRGAMGTGAARAVQLRSASFDTITNTLTITPTRLLPLNRMCQLLIGLNGGITDSSGNPLDGDADGNGGGVYSTYFARGRRISFTDQDGDTVLLSLRGGGTMQLERGFDWNGQSLLLSDTGSNSILKGRVRTRRGSDGIITLDEISGLGAVRNDLGSQIHVTTVS